MSSKQTSGARKAVMAALIGNTGVGISKLIAYLMTGSAPYRGATYLNVLSNLVSDEPPPSALELKSEIPPAVAEVVRRGMAKQSADRPETTLAFLRALALLFSRRDSCLLILLK